MPHDIPPEYFPVTRDWDIDQEDGTFWDCGGEHNDHVAQIGTLTFDANLSMMERRRILALISCAPELWRILRNINRYLLQRPDRISDFAKATEWLSHAIDGECVYSAPDVWAGGSFEAEQSAARAEYLLKWQKGDGEHAE